MLNVIPHNNNNNNNNNNKYLFQSRLDKTIFSLPDFFSRMTHSAPQKSNVSFHVWTQEGRDRSSNACQTICLPFLRVVRICQPIFSEFLQKIIHKKIFVGHLTCKYCKNSKNNKFNKIQEQAICTMASFYYYDQNSSGYCFLEQIKAFVNETSLGLPNLNTKGKTK